MKKMYLVKFLTGYDMFNAGEQAGLKPQSAKQAIAGGHAELVVEGEGEAAELLRAELMDELGLEYTMHIGDVPEEDMDEGEGEGEDAPDLEVGDVEPLEEVNEKGPGGKNKRGKKGKGGKASFDLAE